MHTAIHLRWEPFRDAISYHVGYDLPTGQSKTMTQCPGQLASILVLIRLEPKALHQFWVRAVDMDGNVSSKVVVQNVYQE